MSLSGETETWIGTVPLPRRDDLRRLGPEWSGVTPWSSPMLAVLSRVRWMMLAVAVLLALANTRSGSAAIATDAPPSVAGDIVFAAGGPFGRVEVIAGPLGRWLLVDGVVQSFEPSPVAASDVGSGARPSRVGLLERGILAGLVPEQFPHAHRACVIGLGGGVISRAWMDRGLDVMSVDIDPVVVDAARTGFGFDGPVTVMDGRAFLRETTDLYDVILIDAYTGADRPPHLFTRDAFEDARHRLRPDGVLLLHLIGPEGDADLEAVVDRAGDCFAHVTVLRPPGADAQGVMSHWCFGSDASLAALASLSPHGSPAQRDPHATPAAPAVAAAAPSPPPGAHWRVVVQDLAVSITDLSADGRWGVGWDTSDGLQFRHRLHVVDLERWHTTLTLALPPHTQHLAIAPDGTRLAVSHGEGIDLYDVATGLRARRLSDAAGMVAFDASGSRLAVVGSLDQQRPIRGQRSLDLGVIDLGTGTLIASSETRIVAPRVVAFDGDTVVASGIGGQPYHMIARTYPTHTSIDLSTGVSTTRRGPLTSMRVGEEEPGDPGFGPHPIVVAKETRLEAARRAVAAEAAQLGSRQPRRSKNIALIGDDTSVRFVADRWFELERSRWRAALFQVGRDGAVTWKWSTEEHPREVWGVGGRFVAARDRRAERRVEIVDLATGAAAVSMPYRDEARTPFVKLFPDRVFALDDAGIRCFDPTGALGWSREMAIEYRRVQYADGGRILAYEHMGRVEDEPWPDRRLEFIDGATGVTCLEMPMPGRGTGRLLAMDGERRVVAIRRAEDEAVRIVSLDGGELLGRLEPADGQRIDRLVSAGAGRWLASTGAGTRVLTEDGRDVVVPFAGVERVRRIGRGDRPIVILESRDACAIVDLEDGSVLHRSAAAAPARLAFGDRVLVLTPGQRGRIELIDVESGELIVSIVPLPVGGAFGWIATSPDGWWDASEGSDRVVVLRDGVVVGAGPDAPRRRPGLIGARLRRVLGGPRGSDTQMRRP